MAFVTAAIIGGSIAAAGGIAKLGISLAGRKDRIEEQKAAKKEMAKMKNEYKSLDTSNLSAGFKNPYANMENTMEDLTVNQQQAQFEAQQNQQNQANIMQNLKGAAGGSGVAGLAQAMASQGQLASQKASASIGMQEAQNQQLASQQAARNQQLEAGGEQFAQQQRIAGAEKGRGLEYDKTSTLLGMSQQRTAAANAARQQASADQMSAVGSLVSAGTQIATAGMKMPKLPGGVNPTGVGSTGIGSIDMNQDSIPDYLTQGTNMGYNPKELYGVTGGQTGPSAFPKKKNLKINKNK